MKDRTSKIKSKNKINEKQSLNLSCKFIKLFQRIK